MTAVLPMRLHRAASIISRSGEPDADDAVTACTLVAARIVMLEEALQRVLEDEPNARENAREVLVQGGWWTPPTERPER